jgi:hypothetical protein
MTRRFLRVSLAALALFLTVASSVNLRQANAVSCEDVCPSRGSVICGTIYYPDNTHADCYGE